MTFLEKIRCLLTFGQGVTLPLPNITEHQDPLELFTRWFEDAHKSGILLPEAMSVSTCGSNGQPSSRMVLLKEFDRQSFVFYTNYGSKKSHQLTENNKISLLFHWNVLQRQVRIEGEVEKVSAEQSAHYFHSRDRGSQIGAWASHQSKKLTSTTELKDRVTALNKKHPKGEVPYPEFWGGWRVKPNYIEFWQGRANRLHDRICFEKQLSNESLPNKNEQWQQYKLNP